MSLLHGLRAVFLTARREHRRTMTSRRGFVGRTAILLVLLPVAATMGVSLYQGSPSSWAQDGRTLLMVVGMMFFFLIAMISPAVGAASMREEKETSSLELLKLAGISEGRLVAGKLLGQSVALLTMSAVLVPLLASVQIFGAGELRELGLATVGIAAALTFGVAAGMSFGAWSASTLVAYVRTQLFFGVVFGVWFWGMSEVFESYSGSSVTAELVALMALLILPWMAPFSLMSLALFARPLRSMGVPMLQSHPYAEAILVALCVASAGCWCLAFVLAARSSLRRYGRGSAQGFRVQLSQRRERARARAAAKGRRASDAQVRSARASAAQVSGTPAGTGRALPNPRGARFGGRIGPNPVAWRAMIAAGLSSRLPTVAAAVLVLSQLAVEIPVWLVRMDGSIDIISGIASSWAGWFTFGAAALCLLDGARSFSADKRSGIVELLGMLPMPRRAILTGRMRATLTWAAILCLPWLVHNLSAALAAVALPQPTHANTYIYTPAGETGLLGVGLDAANLVARLLFLNAIGVLCSLTMRNEASAIIAAGLTVFGISMLMLASFGTLATLAHLFELAELEHLWNLLRALSYLLFAGVALAIAQGWGFDQALAKGRTQ